MDWRPNHTDNPGLATEQQQDEILMLCDRAGIEGEVQINDTLSAYALRKIDGVQWLFRDEADEVIRRLRGVRSGEHDNDGARELGSTFMRWVLGGNDGTK